MYWSMPLQIGTFTDEEYRTMSEPHIYRTHVQWSTQRKGKLGSPGLPSIEIATPIQFPGGHADIWSPEHLYVAAAEICLMTTFLSLAEKMKLDFSDYTSQAQGVLEKTDAGLQMTKIVIKPRIVINHDEDPEKAHAVIMKAEKYCLISNSMKTEVTIEAEVVPRVSR